MPQKPRLDPSQILSLAKQTVDAFEDLRVLSENDDEKIALAMTPEVEVARDRLFDLVDRLRPLLNPDGCKPSAARGRLTPFPATSVDGDRIIHSVRLSDAQVFYFYGDYSNIKDSDLDKKTIAALLAVRAQIDHLFAWYHCALPKELSLNAERVLPSLKTAAEMLDEAISASSGDWIPANEAVSLAKEHGRTLTLIHINRFEKQSPQRFGIRPKPPGKHGRHQKEVNKGELLAKLRELPKIEERKAVGTTAISKQEKIRSKIHTYLSFSGASSAKSIAAGIRSTAGVVDEATVERIASNDSAIQKTRDKFELIHERANKHGSP